MKSHGIQIILFVIECFDFLINKFQPFISSIYIFLQWKKTMANQSAKKRVGLNAVSMRNLHLLLLSVYVRRHHVHCICTLFVNKTVFFWKTTNINFLFIFKTNCCFDHDALSLFLLLLFFKKKFPYLLLRMFVWPIDWVFWSLFIEILMVAIVIVNYRLISVSAAASYGADGDLIDGGFVVFFYLLFLFIFV